MATLTIVRRGDGGHSDQRLSELGAGEQSRVDVIEGDGRAGEGFNEAKLDRAQPIAATKVGMNLGDQLIIDFSDGGAAVETAAVHQPLDGRNE